MPRRRGPWTVLSTRHPYRDGFLDVAVDRVLGPDGAPGTRATARVKPGVTVLPVAADGRVTLVRQYRYALGGESLEACSGGIERGERPLTAARRELREELGLRADEWARLATVHLDTSIVRCPDHLFVARGLTAGPPDREPTEVMEAVTMTLTEAADRVASGAIVHAATCVLVLLAARAGG